jgi:pyruvate/2-oxoglutarate dehydrogenase complex dihydrolipoamide dehydrogenase (E3) component
VIFTGNWIPQNELARAEGIALDAGTKGPRVDGNLRTSTPGVFAAGNLLRGAETADAAALEGRYAAGRISEYLGRAGWPGNMLPIEVSDPIEWVSPNAVSAASAGAPLGHVLLRVKAEQRNAEVRVQQGERLLHSQRFGRLRPNTSAYLDDEWLKQVEAGGPPVRVSLG